MSGGGQKIKREAMSQRWEVAKKKKTATKIGGSGAVYEGLRGRLW